jgi:hypothetical protein
MSADINWDNVSLYDLLSDIDRAKARRVQIEESADRKVVTLVFPDGDEWVVPGRHYRTADYNRTLYVRLKLRLTS